MFIKGEKNEKEENVTETWKKVSIRSSIHFHIFLLLRAYFHSLLVCLHSIYVFYIFLLVCVYSHVNLMNALQMKPRS